MRQSLLTLPIPAINLHIAVTTQCHLPVVTWCLNVVLMPASHQIFEPRKAGSTTVNFSNAFRFFKT